MASPHVKRAFWMLAAVAAAAEAGVIYTQWPKPPLKVCASFELGDLLAAASSAEAELRAARFVLQKGPREDAMKEVMRLETKSAAAWNEVARYKQKDLERQKASGKAASGASCS